MSRLTEMAGNIIPAIATTNAMTAGLCVLQALKVLKGDYDHAKMVRLFNHCSSIYTNLVLMCRSFSSAQELVQSTPSP
jgi:hypothetical protein